MVSTMVGGGIIALPFAFLQLGFGLSLTLVIFTWLQTSNSTWLYLTVKDLIPGKPESLYEIGYMLMKRKSIFIISSVLTLNSLGLVMAYYIVYSTTILSVVTDLADLKDGDFFAYRSVWVLLLAILVLPICLLK